MFDKSIFQLSIYPYFPKRCLIYLLEYTLSSLRICFLLLIFLDICKYMYLYICMYVCVYCICVCVCVYIYVYIHICPYIHRYIHIYKYIYLQIFRNINNRKHILRELKVYSIRYIKYLFGKYGYINN